MLIDTIRQCLVVPDLKRERLISQIQSALHNSTHCAFKSIEVLAGTLMSMHWAFGGLSRMMTLSLHADLKAAAGTRYLCLSETSIQDLQFWLVGFDHYNGINPIWRPSGFDLTIFSDAAGRNLQNMGGWGGWTRTAAGIIKIAKGTWDESISNTHSTFQELQAIYNNVLSFNRSKELVGKRILIKTDNQAVFFIINKSGSRVPMVHAVCKLFLWYCIHNNIYARATWIPRDMNEFADFYSKFSESSDWKLNPAVFRDLQRRFRVTFDIDLFASHENTQTTNYFSFFCTTSCQGVDAFNYVWGRACWCNPPFNLIARVIAHGIACQAKMCLICPFTPSAAWWHAVTTSDGRHFAPFVQEFVFLGRSNTLFLDGRKHYTYSSYPPRWQTFALLVDFASAWSQIPVPEKP